MKASYDTEKAISAITHDKKLDGDSINYVFVEKIGEFEFRQSSLSDFCETIRKNAEAL